VLGIGVRADREKQEDNVYNLACSVAEHLGVGDVVKRDHVVANCDNVGAGHGVPTDGMIEAVKLLARKESILLDPVYSRKGMDGLIYLVRKGAFKEDENIVFLHTGVSAGLFGYRTCFGFEDYR
jgi:L-cysteate sulfo-lyase